LRNSAGDDARFVAAAKGGDKRSATR